MMRCVWNVDIVLMYAKMRLESAPDILSGRGKPISVSDAVSAVLHVRKMQSLEDRIIRL